MLGSTKSDKCARKCGAVLGVLGFAALQLASAAILAWCAGLIPELPWLQWVLRALALLSVVPLPFAAVVLKQRFKEIEGGESDAAAQY